MEMRLNSSSSKTIAMHPRLTRFMGRNDVILLHPGITNQGVGRKQFLLSQKFKKKRFLKNITNIDSDGAIPPVALYTGK